jgi:hypothetical protein
MEKDTENQVGYKTPPKASQFKKGRSGNPSGRPRRALGIAELLEKVSKQKVLTQGKNGLKSMSKAEASITQLLNKAAGGDLKAAKILTDLMTRFPEIAKCKDLKDTEKNIREKFLAALERYER